MSVIGLNQKEAAIYRTALERGGGTIMDLSRASGIERTSLYRHLESMINQGFIEMASRGKRTLYLPVDPLIIRNIVQQRTKALNEMLLDLHDHFSLQTGKSVVTYYQGKQGVIALYEKFYAEVAKMTRTQASLYIFGHSFEALEALPDFFPEFIARRAKLNVETKIILPQSERPPEGISGTDDPKIVARYNLHIQEKKYISKKYEYNGAILIMRDQVATIDFKTFFGAVTKNKNLAQTWRMYFEFIWDHLPDEPSTKQP